MFSKERITLLVSHDIPQLGVAGSHAAVVKQVAFSAPTRV